MEHLIMECVKIRRLLVLLLLAVTISLALLAVSSAAEILQGPSVKTLNLAPDGSIAESVTFGGNVLGGVSPIVSGLHVPILRTVNVYPDGSYVNNNGVIGVVPSSLTPLTTGIQGPSSRTVNVGPDGSVVDSYTAGGVVSDDGSVLIAPYLHSSYYQGVVPNLVHTVVPAVPVAKSVYAPGFYSGFVPLPYGKSLISGPSGTIVAK